MSDLPPVSSATRVDLSLPQKFTVKDGLLVIGEKRFLVRNGGEAIHNDVLLQKVAKIMNQHADTSKISDPSLSEEEDHTFSRTSPEKIHITISGESIKVKKGVGEEDIHKTEELPENSTSLENQVEKTLSRIAEHSRHARQLDRICREHGFTKEAVKSALQNILDEPPMRESGVGGWQENTLSHMLHSYGNDALRSSLQSFQKTYNPPSSNTAHSSKACEKELRLYILENMVRPPKQLAVSDEKSPQYIQQFSVGTDSGQPLEFTPNKAHSSTLDKKADAKKVGNTNLGSVVQTSHNEEDGSSVREKCIVTRSGRSNSGHRLEELVEFAAREHATSQDHSCLKPVHGRENTFEFTHHITSYLDSSTIKSASTIPKSAVKAIKDLFMKDGANVDNERRQLTELLQSLDQWTGDKEITMTNKEGETVTIILKKPILSNELFSSTVRGVHVGSSRLIDMGYKTRDRIECVNGLQLMQMALQEGKIRVSEEEYQELIEALPEHQRALFFEKRDENAPYTFKEIPYQALLSDTSPHSKALASKEMDLFRAQWGELLGKKALEGDTKSEALFSVVFRKSLVGVTEDQLPDICTTPVTVDNELHPADLEIWRNYLDSSLGISFGKQCKSGTDRTGVGVALAWAADAFKQEHGREYLPGKMAAEDDELHFKCLFYKALDQFGLSITVETKGYPGLKLFDGVKVFGGKGNPVPLKYLFNESDVQKPVFQNVWKKYFPEREVPKEAFVRLPEDQKGVAKYYGEYTDRYMIGSKSKGKPEKSNFLAEVPFNRTKCKEEAFNILKKCIGEKNFPYTLPTKDDEKKAFLNNLFDENLNLKPHIKRLGLGQQDASKKLHDEIVALENSQKNVLLNLQQVEASPLLSHKARIGANLQAIREESIISHHDDRAVKSFKDIHEAEKALQDAKIALQENKAKIALLKQVEWLHQVQNESRSAILETNTWDKAHIQEGTRPKRSPTKNIFDGLSLEEI